jgi:hypothetical protein
MPDGLGDSDHPLSAFTPLSDFEASVGSDFGQSPLNILSSEYLDATRTEPLLGRIDELLERLIVGHAK